VITAPEKQAQFTPRQGQFLAFIHAYSKLNRQSPAEADIQRFFSISSASTHQMVVTLERHGFIKRVPGASRSIQLLVPHTDLPELE
jgi:repressor LexA